MQCRILFHDRSLQRFDWCKLSENDTQPVECGSADIEQLAEVCAQSTQVIVFLAQQDILLTQPVLPARASKQQLAAIPYTLEESLAQDIEDCFFAQLPQQPDQTVPVAVIEREIMESVTALLSRLHINARQILPAACLCPCSQDEDWLASICAVEGGWLLRYGAHHGLFCETALLETTLSRLAKNVDSTRNRIDLYTEQNLPALAENSAFKLNHLAAIPLLAQPVDFTTCINLKQKDFLSSHQWTGVIKRWRWPAVALLLLGIVSVAGVLIDSWQKQQQLNQIIAQQQSLLKPYLAGQAVSQQPKNQLVKLLSQSRGGQGQVGFIDLLYEFSRLKAGFDQLKVDKIVYQKGQLIVNLEAPDLKAMEAFRARLESSRYPGRIENVSINPDKTTGRLVMEAAS